MKRSGTRIAWNFFAVLLLGGCDPVPVQHPASSAPAYPSIQTPAQPANLPPPGTPSQGQVTGSQRGQYVWDKMMEGVTMGGSIAGPYGAGGGLIIGLITGLLTADSYYAQLNSQIQSEKEKNKELETQIEEEMERQRELEAQLGKSPEPSEEKREENKITQTAAIQKAKDNPTVKKKEPTVSVASPRKRELSPTPQSSPFKNIEVRDLNQDGVPDLWITYNPLKPGEIVRQEEDTNGDGAIDTWSTFKDGKLVRREVDTKRTGRPDVVYTYANDKIAREERDESDEGRPSLRAIYQDGRLAKVEKDLDRDGKMDLWIYYDTAKDKEVVLKEEKDLNGDGTVDLWSYYEGGRLVRRDVSAVGLDYLSKQEQESRVSPPKNPLSPTPES